eukprot:scaffold55745_cov66-Phaeocystis_antarctica.AAC.5
MSCVQVLGPMLTPATSNPLRPTRRSLRPPPAPYPGAGTRDGAVPTGGSSGWLSVASSIWRSESERPSRATPGSQAVLTSTTEKPLAPRAAHAAAHSAASDIPDPSCT